MSKGPDIVITWVDGSDPEWLVEKALYTTRTTHEDDKNERYRDYHTLKYWFRGVEKCASWNPDIYFVTWGHLPEWLDTSNPRLHVVKHSDYIPHEYLPTYNSHTIELNFHRIKGLSEEFIYLNDDVFFLRRVVPEDFFKNGRPCDILALQPVVANPSNPVMSHIYLNNMLVLSKYFNKRENIRKQWKKYYHLGYPLMYWGYNFLELAFPLFSGMYTSHGVSPLCKRTYEILWRKEYDLLDATCRHKIRHIDDVNQYLLREWQKLSGDFVAYNINKNFRYFNMSDNNQKLVQTIRERKAATICINDANKPINFRKAAKEINRAFEDIFPKKSTFEKGSN
jgi:hypothetical protein